MKINQTFKSTWCAATLLAGSMALAPAASTIMTFNVDMSVQIGTGAFIPGTDHVSVRGMFNGWGELVLTNDPAALNPNLYSGTVNNTTTPNGYIEGYKFYNSQGGVWENGAVNASDKHRNVRLPANSGASLVLPPVFFNDAGDQVVNQVTFRVNMAQRVNTGAFDPGVHTVYARGTFNGWGLSFPLTHDPLILTTNGAGLVTSNVYVGTYAVSGGTNGSCQFKYAAEPGGSWEENISAINVDEGNRSFVNIGDQVLPLVDYGDVPYSSVVTNDITFRVDMTAQRFAGRFDPAAGHTVEVRGIFNSWSQGTYLLTNDPAALNTNVYSGVVRIADTPGLSQPYKFTFNNPGVNWESSVPKLTTPDTGPNDYNRVYTLPATQGLVTTDLPVVLFDDMQVTDYLPANTLVTFTVDMNSATGAVSGVSGYTNAFNPGVDKVYINGEFIPWYGWWNSANPVAVPQYEMLPIGGGIYSNQFLVPQGANLRVGYKYGIGFGGAPGPDDNEASGGQDHRRVIRTTATGSYTMPQDKFGNQYNEPLFTPAARSDGLLQVGTPSGGTVPVSWLGRPGAHLQSANSVTGPWTDHLDTDGTNWTAGASSVNGLVSTTNWPATGNKFFRLVKP